jgi:hypothetical protein
MFSVMICFIDSLYLFIHCIVIHTLMLTIVLIMVSNLHVSNVKSNVP